MKRIFFILTASVGILSVAIGLLWLLQGLGLIYIEPILCVAECETVTGKSLQWQVSGAILAIFGLLFTFFSLRRVKK